MAKMMMGQIDHARKRIQELKAAKRGKVPQKPDIQGGSNVLKAIREGELVVSTARLRQAFDAFLERITAPTVIKTNGNYQNDYKDSYKIGESIPATVEDALANIVYAVPNAAEVERFEAETEEYERLGRILDDRAAVVEDAIVLGDQHVALQALQEFATFNPADFKETGL